MVTTAHNTSRTAHLLALMKKGDGAVNSRAFAAMSAIDNRDMIARVPAIPPFPIDIWNTADRFDATNDFYGAQLPSVRDTTRGHGR